ncbi:MAG: YkgJ family cysteine cluster protein [Halodesulfurarchaeum sp.]|nr:YkgJ family cysteine cluster protein [Halodesulfurarchaeum sp.]
MDRLEAALTWARSINPEAIAADLQEIGFECTRCGQCCRGTEDEPHTATVFPDEIREIHEATDHSWDEIARPMPFGLDEDGGETFEWALQTDADRQCTFLETVDGHTSCSIYDSRPLLCRTYPFSLALPGTGIAESAAVESAGRVRASECPGLGAEMSQERALALANTLRERAIREIQETIALREHYAPQAEADSIVVHDSEGPKRPDGRPFDESPGNNY